MSAPSPRSPSGSTLPPSRRRRWWLRIPLILLAQLLLVLVLVLGWVLGTQSGLRFALRMAEELGPEGLLTVDQARGRFLGDVRLDGVRVRAPGLDLDLQELVLRWRPRALLGATLHIEALTARGLAVTVAPSGEEPQEKEPAAFALPEVVLPVRVEIVQALVEDARFAAPGAEPFRLERASLSAAAGESLVELRAFSLDLPQPRLRASAQGRAELTGAYPLRLTLDWSLALPPQARLEGEGRLDGDLARLTLEHNLSGSARARLSAVVVSVLEAPGWEATLEILGVDTVAFAADAPQLDLAGRLRSSGDLQEARVEGTLSGTAPELPEFGRLDADLDVTWSDRVLRIAAVQVRESGSGAALRADGRLDLRAAPGRFEVAAAWEQVRWPLTGVALAESRQGKLDAEGTFEDFRYRLDAQIFGRDIPEAALALAGEGDASGTRIETLAIDTLGGDLKGRGSATWAPQVGWDLALDVRELDPGRQWSGAPAIPELALQSSGGLDGFEYRLRGRAARSSLVPAVALEVAGKGDLSGTRLQTLRIQTLGGSIEGAGEAGWDPAVRWDASLDVAGIDPGVQWPEWPGAVSARIASRGRLEAGEPVVSAGVQGLAGTLRGYPLAGDVRIAMDGLDDIRVEELALSSGPTSLQAQGQAGERLDLGFALRSPDLATLLPDARGSVRAEGKVTGTREHPAVALELAAEGVQVADQGLERLGGKAAVDLGPAGAGQIDIDLTGNGLVAGGLRFATVALRGSGDLAAHRLSAELSGEPLSLSLEASGGVEGEAGYAGEVSALVLETADFGTWRLLQPAPVTLAGETLTAGPICIRDETDSGGCLRFAQPAAGAWEAEADFDKLAFERLGPFLPEDLQLEGEARAEADLKAADGVLRGTASLLIPRGQLRAGLADPPVTIDFSSARLALEAGGDLRASLSLPLEGLGGVEGEATLPGWRLDAPARADQPVRGGVRARIDDLALVEQLVPDVTGVAGRIEADLQASGTVANPGVSGYARLFEGGLEVPFIGLRIADIALRADAVDLERIDISGGLTAGDGRLDLDGRAGLGPGGPTVDLVAAGENLTVADSKEYFALVSPQIQVDVGPGRTSVTGRVRVPEARIRTKTLPAGTVTPSPDVVLASEAREQQVSGHATVVDLSLVLGEQVAIDAFGLRGRLEGALRVLQEPGTELLGDGQLAILDGVYRISSGLGLSAAIGKPLTIEQGFLNWARSPIANPFLVLTAQREGGDVTAGLRVFGTIKNPKMTFFSPSDPGMTQQEASTYLLTGIPPKRGGEEPDRSLSVGTYVAPKLFLEYESSLGDESDKVKLRYDLNRWIELQTETGEAQGADIFFTFEK